MWFTNGFLWPIYRFHKHSHVKLAFCVFPFCYDVILWKHMKYFIYFTHVANCMKTRKTRNSHRLGDHAQRSKPKSVKKCAFGREKTLHVHGNSVNSVKIKNAPDQHENTNGSRKMRIFMNHRCVSHLWPIWYVICMWHIETKAILL